MRSLWTTYRNSLIAALAAAMLTPLAPAAQAAPLNLNYDPDSEVDVELVLAVDISQSMDRDEQEIQRAGYVSALTSEEVLEAIRYGPTGRIAVTYMEWGGADEQFVVAEWALINDAVTARAFAAKLAEAPIRHKQRTSIASALKQAVNLIQLNRFNGMRKVIDISGDGPNNQGGRVTEARDEVLTSGITINGLPLMMKAEKNTWQAMMNLDHYYEDCVIGGPGAFSIPVRSTDAFADAIRMKLVLEIAGISPNGNALVQKAAARKKVTCSLYD